jgi:hypothetical protein
LTNFGGSTQRRALPGSSKVTQVCSFAQGVCVSDLLSETARDAEFQHRRKPMNNRTFRTTVSAIVNLDLVKQVKPHTNGECFLVLESGAQVKVSQSYRDVVARFVH